MIFEKTIVLTKQNKLDFQLDFQKLLLKTGWLVRLEGYALLLLVYLSFLNAFFTKSDVLRALDYCSIVVGLFVYLRIYGRNQRRNADYLSRVYERDEWTVTCRFYSDRIEVSEPDNSATFQKDWIKHLIENEKYIYLRGDSNYSLILPKDQFSGEELASIRGTYQPSPPP